MKKKEIDLFNILLGIIIGCLIGYLIFSQIKPTENNNTDEVINEEVYGTIYTIQLGCNSSLDALDLTIERLNVLGIYYETYEEGGKFYIFTNVFQTLEEAQNKKQIMESYGFTVSIRSDYLLDLPKNVITQYDKYEFYTEIINNLFCSLNGETIVISEKYYSNPIDVELFSNMTLLMIIKNETIIQNYQLNTLCLLLKKLK